jgi:hypothetical protein
MLTISICWFAGLLIAKPVVAFGQANEPTVIAGIVQDDSGTPLSMVNVQIEGTFDGDATNEKGKFVFATRVPGKGVLRASLMGYEPVSIAVELSHGDSIFLHITMEEAVAKDGSKVRVGRTYAPRIRQIVW